MADKRSRIVFGLFLVSAVVVLALSLYTGIALNSVVESLENSRSQRLLAEAQSTSLIVSAEELESITDVASLASEQGAAIQRRVSAFAALHNLSEITYIRQLPSGELQYIVGSSTSGATYDITAPTFASDEYIDQCFSGTIVATDLQQSQSNENNLMAYSPVLDQDGTVVAVAAVGIDDSSVLQTDGTIRNLTIILLVCIAVVILAACANVLLQVRKEHELQESVRVQKLMIEISQILSTESPFSERLNETMEILGSYLGAYRVYIVNLSEKDLGQALRQHWSLDGTGPEGKIDSAPAQHELMNKTFKLNNKTRCTTVHSHNVKQTDGMQYVQLTEANTEAFIWSPLIVQNELWGVLTLDFTRSRRQFHEKDIQLVESAASDLVGAIQRELYSEQRERALDQAVTASEAKGEFLSNMSHEMRTPMNAIIGMTSIAMDSDDLERKDYCLQHIKDASAHLLTIINDVLDMSSLQSNELTLINKPFDIRKALNEVVRDYTHKLDEHEQVFTLDLDERIPAVLVGDKQRLSKVVSNLLSNATKFTPNGGSITLRAKHLSTDEKGHCIFFEIEDNGIGIDEETLGSLFGSFEQADSGSNRKYGGTGLGLAISRRLIELMGGQIGVDSVANEGSTFYFTVVMEEGVLDVAEQEEQTKLELAEADENTPANESVAEENEEVDQKDAVQDSSKEKDSTEEPKTKRVVPDLSSYRIMLAEDIDINREVVMALLAESGIQIDTTVNGLEVFDAVKNDPAKYDLIFMDLQMPEMDGLDATRRIRALSHPEIAELPIIAMTANVHPDDIEACLDAGMNNHIGKPVDLDEIYRILDEYLPKH